MFSCQLCPSSNNEYCYVSRYCSKCIELKNIIKIYGIDEVLDKVKTIYVRDKKPLENRTKTIALASLEEEKIKLIEPIKNIKIDITPTDIYDRVIPSPPPLPLKKSLRSAKK